MPARVASPASGEVLPLRMLASPSPPRTQSAPQELQPTPLRAAPEAVGDCRAPKDFAGAASLRTMADATNEAALSPENVGEAVQVCDVCLTETNSMEVRSCCGAKICLPCFEEYLDGRVMAGTTRIECVNCDRPVAAHIVLRVLTRNGRLRARDEFARLLRGDKKCPRCQLILAKFEGASCPQCGLSWCFRCEATHEGVSCDLFSAAYRSQLRSWAKSMSEGQWNAQKCPRCKVYIQRASGCDHMRCAHCYTHFCYRCGGRLRHVKFFGDHYSKLSVFGCKYRYKPNKPIQRKLVRSAVFVARLVAIPLAGAGALCGIALLALLAVPMYAGYRVHRNVSRTHSKSRSSSDQTPNDAGSANDRSATNSSSSGKISSTAASSV
ncbi:IBR domain containing protein-like [Tropilaelaps mercedesae]|uniref:IBR domain containing protein-like n=1 Tax=Tropilaelaps mercedesae TaxID=418985 RepID=A0A1V9X5D0_9ACAR|nr:IBR domain containing protein-like [Tropilaelaps mercedesae]